MGLALNLIALVMVIGLSWVAMIWMSGRFHGERQDFSAQAFGSRASRPDSAGSELGDDLDGLVPEVHRANECATCNGSGARKSQGRLSPCPVCEGTGVLA